MLATLLTALTCSQSILIVATKLRRGQYVYSTVSANLTVELLKLLVSGLGILVEVNRDGITAETSIKMSLKDAVAYSIPAALYLAKNLLQYKVLLYVDAPSYQILKNLNVLTTTLLYAILLRKNVNSLQWCAMVLLSAGCAVSQLETRSNAVLDLSYRGIFMATVMALLSSFASVYSEFILKKDFKRSLHVQNFYLYFFGVTLNFIVFVNSKTSKRPFFGGFSYLVWLMIVNHAFSGVIVSYVLKFSNNLTKVKATSAAVLLTTLLSAMFLRFNLTLQFALGFIIVVTALYIPTASHH